MYLAVYVKHVVGSNRNPHSKQSIQVCWLLLVMGNDIVLCVNIVPILPILYHNFVSYRKLYNIHIVSKKFALLC